MIERVDMGMEDAGCLPGEKERAKGKKGGWGNDYRREGSFGSLTIY
jgi:hypothetical protein